MTSKQAEVQMGVAIKMIAAGLILYARAYNAWAKELLDDPEYKLGNDALGSEAWSDIANGVIRGFLNLPLRGYEPIEVSREIEAAAKTAGIDLHK